MFIVLYLELFAVQTELITSFSRYNINLQKYLSGSMFSKQYFLCDEMSDHAH